jgi:hypothetical protein
MVKTIGKPPQSVNDESGEELMADRIGWIFVGHEVLGRGAPFSARVTKPPPKACSHLIS